MRGLVCILVVAACGSGDSDYHPLPDGPKSTESAQLGMNDVSILLPLPETAASPVIAKLLAFNRDLIPRDVFDRLVTAPGDVINKYDEFHAVAIRFDLCDRPTPGPCAAGDDGRLRIVYQPIFDSMGKTQAFDVALHAFYRIPNYELDILVAHLRALAALEPTPITDPLHVSTAVWNVEYADALRDLVNHHSHELTRLTLFAQNAFTASLNWAFRGEEMKGGQLTPITIPDIGQRQQRTILSGGDTTYSTTPVADKPAGFATAIDSAAFGAASPAARMQALEAMAAIQNPMLHTAETVQCIGCHVTTFLTARRAVVAGVDPTAVTNRFISQRFDLSTTGKSTTNDRSLRAFGYLFSEPMISQRVVNDTAQVLVEIDARFPPAMP